MGILIYYYLFLLMQLFVIHLYTFYIWKEHVPSWKFSRIEEEKNIRENYITYYTHIFINSVS